MLCFGKTVTSLNYVTLFGGKICHACASCDLLLQECGSHMIPFGRKKQKKHYSYTSIVSLNYSYHHSWTVLAKHQNQQCCPKSC